MANVYAKQLAQSEQKKGMSRKKKSIIIISCVLAVLIAVSLILSFTAVRPYNKFKDVTSPSNIVVSAGNPKRSPNTVKGDANYDDFINNFKASAFSPMHALLEGQFANGLKIVVDEDEDDDVTPYIYSTTLESLPSLATSSSYYVEFWFDQNKEVTIKGITISYNRLGFYVTDSESQITKTQVYLYDTHAWGIADQDDEYYTYDVTMKTNFTKLFAFINETYTF